MTFSIEGAKIFARIHTGIPVLGDILISETLVVSWIVMAIITVLCIVLTRNLKVTNISKRQALAEMLVETANNFVRNNTGGGHKFDKLIPFVAALFTTSVISNLISLIGLRSPTADLSTEAAWAVVVFIMITMEKIKAGGILGYMKDGRMELEEIYRFENGMVKKDGHLFWDVNHLSEEIIDPGYSVPKHII